MKIRTAFALLLMALLVSCTTMPQIERPETKIELQEDNESINYKLKELFNRIQPVISEDKQEIKTIAILEFSNDYPLLSQYIRDYWGEVVHTQGVFKIIERNDLQKILDEQNLQLSGIVDDTTAKKVGNIIGVNYICYGNIVDIKTYIRMFAKIVEIETGEIVGIGSTNITKTQELNSLLEIDMDIDKIEREKKLIVIKNWQVNRIRNEFEGATIYTFTVKAPEKGNLIIGYVKNDDPSRSYIRIGISDWPFGGIVPSDPKFDIKLDNGKVETIRLGWISWDEKKGHIEFSSGGYYVYTYKNNQRILFDYIISNNKLAFRSSDRVQSFLVEGLIDTIGNYGISYDEIESAIGNEEF